MKSLIIYSKFDRPFKRFADYMIFCTTHKIPPTSRPLQIVSMLPHGWKKKVIDLNTAKLQDEHIKWADIIFISTTVLQRASTRKTFDRCKQKGKKVVVIEKSPRHKQDHFYSPAPHRPFHNLDYIFSKSDSGQRMARWFKNNVHKKYFHRKDLRGGIKKFIRNELSRLEKKYEHIDVISLFSGGADSLLATLKFARENPDHRILLVTYVHHFHERNTIRFVAYFRNLKAIKASTNIIGHEVIDIGNAFDSLSNKFKERYREQKLYPCIACKALMIYLSDIILLNFKTKETKKRSKYIITGNRGPAVMTFFQQTKRYETYVRKCVCSARYFSPIYDLHNKDDIFNALKTFGVKKSHIYKQILCLVPFLGLDMGYHDRRMANYFRRGYRLLRDIIAELKKNDQLKVSMLRGCFP